MQWKTKSPRSNSCEHVRSFKSAGPWHVPNNFFQRFFDHTSFPLSLSISFCLSRFHTLRADPQINCATTSFAQVLEPIGSLCMIMGLAPRVRFHELYSCEKVFSVKNRKKFMFLNIHNIYVSRCQKIFYIRQPNVILLINHPPWGFKCK